MFHGRVADPHKSHLSQLLRSSFHSDSHRFVSFNNTSVFCSPIVRQVSCNFHVEVLRGVAAGIGTSNILRAFFPVSLTSPSAGSMKQTPDASDFPYLWPQESGLGVSCFFVSRSPYNVYPSGGFSSKIMNFVKPVHVNVPVIVDAFLQHYIQQRTCSPGHVNVFQWNRG